jgi:hypothetical protein
VPAYERFFACLGPGGASANPLSGTRGRCVPSAPMPGKSRWSLCEGPVARIGRSAEAARGLELRRICDVRRAHNRLGRAHVVPCGCRLLAVTAFGWWWAATRRAWSPGSGAATDIGVTPVVGIVATGGCQRRSLACHHPGGGVPWRQVRSALNHHVELELGSSIAALPADSIDVRAPGSVIRW